MRTLFLVLAIAQHIIRSTALDCEHYCPVTWNHTDPATGETELLWAAYYSYEFGDIENVLICGYRHPGVEESIGACAYDSDGNFFPSISDPAHGYYLESFTDCWQKDPGCPTKTTSTPTPTPTTGQRKKCQDTKALVDLTCKIGSVPGQIGDLFCGGSFGLASAANLLTSYVLTKPADSRNAQEDWDNKVSAATAYGQLATTAARAFFAVGPYGQAFCAVTSIAGLLGSLCNALSAKFYNCDSLPVRRYAYPVRITSTPARLWARPTPTSVLVSRNPLKRSDNPCTDFINTYQLDALCADIPATIDCPYTSADLVAEGIPQDEADQFVASCQAAQEMSAGLNFICGENYLAHALEPWCGPELYHLDGVPADPEWIAAHSGSTSSMGSTTTTTSTSITSDSSTTVTTSSTSSVSTTSMSTTPTSTSTLTSQSTSTLSTTTGATTTTSTASSVSTASSTTSTPTSTQSSSTSSTSTPTTTSTSSSASVTTSASPSSGTTSSSVSTSTATTLSVTTSTSTTSVPSASLASPSTLTPTSSSNAPASSTSSEPPQSTVGQPTPSRSSAPTSPPGSPAASQIGSTTAAATPSVQAPSPTIPSEPTHEEWTELHPNGIQGKCLDLKWNWRVNGQRVQVYDCNGTGAQKWIISKGATHVRLAGTNFCLDAGTYPHNFVKMKIWDCYDIPAQRWWFTDDLRIAVQDHGLCLDVKDGDLSKGIVQTYKCTDYNTNQIWSW